MCAIGSSSQLVVLLSTSLVALATAAPATAQDATPEKSVAGDEEVKEVIVTGTRSVGMTAADSSAPVTVLAPDSLQHSGTGNLQQALDQQLPAFSVTSVGGDLANLTLSAALRGLSPNDTLVMIDGKRRHGTANLDVAEGGAAPDLSLIPLNAISRIEVLTDGAAAEYGTDAIAGVINIILKDNPDSRMLTVTGGQFTAGDGQSYDISPNFGFKLGERGFVNVTFEQRYHNFTQRGGADSSLITANGTPASGLPYDINTIPGYPDTNRILGDAQLKQYTGLINAGYDLTDNLHLYDFATYGYKVGRAYENTRFPDNVIASPVLGVEGTYTTPGELIFAPQGFNPEESIKETDYADTLGIKGTAGKWNWDLSTTYGRDSDDIFTLDSADRSLFINTHTTPTNFYDGTFVNSEWTDNLDVSRPIEIGLAKPLNLAMGVEVRKDYYAIYAGQPESYYAEGAQGYVGFTPQNAGTHNRTNYGGYVDLALNPTDKLKIETAGRYEDYSDFGSTKIGEFTARYDFTDAFALRGTVQSGFRAPTLAEEYYNSTNVAPTYASAQLPADSKAAQILGLGPLKPETSASYSLGIVTHPADRVEVTVDAYSISIHNRIVDSPDYYGIGGAVNSPNVLAAIQANGNQVDNTAPLVYADLLFNGYDTITRGVDLTANYTLHLEQLGRLRFTLAANYNNTYVTNIPGTPPQLAPLPLFNPFDLANVGNTEKTVSKLSVNWTLGKFSLDLFESYYGPYYTLNTPNGGLPLYREQRNAAFLTDFELGYFVTDAIKLSVGGRNIFNRLPELSPYTATGGLVNTGDSLRNAPLSTPYGPDGAYFYGGLSVLF